MQPKKLKWHSLVVDPRRTVSGFNIRRQDRQNIRDLARSILENGQLHECTGELLADGRIKIWGGRGRRAAVLYIVKHWDPNFKLRVRVANRPLSPDEVFKIQMADNLQLPMTAVEEARAIERVYVVYHRLHKRRPTVREMAKIASRSERKVRRALRFVSLDPTVQKMVKDHLIVYGVAVELAALRREKQLGTAEHIILANLKTEPAVRYVRTLVGGRDGQIGMFAGQTEIEIREQGFRLSFRHAFDHAANDAAGYFKRVLWYLNRFATKERRVEMSRKIKEILTALVISADEFERLLLEADPPRSRELLVRKGGVKRKVS